MPIGSHLLVEGEGIGTRGGGQTIEDQRPARLIEDVGDGDEGVDLGRLWNLERGADGLCGLLACGDDGPEMRQTGE